MFLDIWHLGLYFICVFMYICMSLYQLWAQYDIQQARICFSIPVCFSHWDNSFFSAEVFFSYSPISACGYLPGYCNHTQKTHASSTSSCVLGFPLHLKKISCYKYYLILCYILRGRIVIWFHSLTHRKLFSQQLC